MYVGMLQHALDYRVEPRCREHSAKVLDVVENSQLYIGPFRRYRYTTGIHNTKIANVITATTWRRVTSQRQIYTYTRVETDTLFRE